MRTVAAAGRSRIRPARAWQAMRRISKLGECHRHASSNRRRHIYAAAAIIYIDSQGRKSTGGPWTQTMSGAFGMQESLADGGVIRKLWIGEADPLPRSSAASRPDSRHSRFGGGVSDDFIRNYVDTTFGLGSVVHGFFADGVLRGAAELRPAGPRLRPRGRGRPQHREPTGRATASARHCSTARCSPPATAASRPCTWPASPTTGGCRSWRGNSPPN